MVQEVVDVTTAVKLLFNNYQFTTRILTKQAI
jgi:hypothetical protein